MVHAIDEFVTDPANEASVGDFLKQVCNLLFTNDVVTQGTCEAWVTEYADDIIELLVNQYLKPEEVCLRLGLCP